MLRVFKIETKKFENNLTVQSSNYLSQTRGVGGDKSENHREKN